jgi:hypothetical protein
VLHGVHRLTGLLGKAGHPAVGTKAAAAASTPMADHRWAPSCPTYSQPTALADAPPNPGSRQICQSCLDSLGAMVDPLTEPAFDDAHASDPDVVEVYHGTPSALGRQLSSFRPLTYASASGNRGSRQPCGPRRRPTPRRRGG